MNRILQKRWILSSVLLLGMTTTLPAVNTVFAETTSGVHEVEATELTLPHDDLLENLADSKEGAQRPIEEVPTFSFEHKEMYGTTGETTEVVIQVDRAIEQIQMAIPKELTIQQDKLPEDIEAVKITETKWWFTAEARTKFTIPLTSETKGKFTIFVEDEVEGTIEFEESLAEPEIEEEEVTNESDTLDEKDVVEGTVTPMDQEDDDPTKKQEIEEIALATTSTVSTWAQFRTAINTNSVTEINVLADISGNTSLNPIARSLTIHGNGHVVNIGSESFWINGSNRNITVRNIILITSHQSLFNTNSTARNTNFIFSDINGVASNTFLSVWSTPNGNQVDNNVSVTFDGGINILKKRATQIRNLTVKNGAVVTVEELISSREAAGVLDSTILIEEGGELTVNGSLNNVSRLIVDGYLKINNNRIIMGPRGDRQIVVRKNGNLIVVGTAGAGLIANQLNSLTIENGAEFDFINRSGPVTNLSSAFNVSINTLNLAVWNLGRSDVESSLPSQNFENLEAKLTGTNASSITETNHNGFRSTYSKKGLAGYSRISSSGIATEGPLDPLAPDKEIEPDNPPLIPDNQGNLRIGFVSQFVFGEQERRLFEEATYYASPQLRLDANGEPIESEPKPNYVQISDNRTEADGWELSVRQREQFKTEQGSELTGSRLQLKNRQLVSNHEGTKPREISSEEILILEPGERKPLLTSSNGEGKGTWIYRFGDAQTAGESVALVVPKGANPEITTYSTTLVWELSAVPVN